jgi:prevent-host-death family protein
MGINPYIRYLNAAFLPIYFWIGWDWSNDQFNNAHVATCVIMYPQGAQIMRETSVGIRELKNRLSEYIQRVKAGERIIITERGKPVGQILPVQAEHSDRLANLVEAGLVEWNGQPLPPYEPKAVNRSNRLVSDLVAEDRG